MSSLEKKIKALSGRPSKKTSRNVVRAYIAKNIPKSGSTIKNRIKKLKGDTTWN